MEEFTEALSSGSIVMIVGLALMALAPLLGPELTDKLASQPKKIVSLIRALCIGIGVPLAGADILGLPWWVALLGAVYMALQSDGLRRTIWELIPGKKKDTKPPSPSIVPLSLLVLVLAIGSFAGCSVHQAQIGTQTSLASAAATLDATDMALRQIGQERVSDTVEELAEEEAGAPVAGIVGDVLTGVVEFSRLIERLIAMIRLAVDAEDVNELQRVGDILTRETLRAREMLEEAEALVPDPAGLQARLDDWYQAVRGLEISVSTLVALQASAETWYATGDLPANWDPLCSALRDDVEALIGFLETIGVDLPGGLDSAGAFTEAVCGYVSNLQGD